MINQFKDQDHTRTAPETVAYDKQWKRRLQKERSSAFVRAKILQNNYRKRKLEWEQFMKTKREEEEEVRVMNKLISRMLVGD